MVPLNRLQFDDPSAPPLSQSAFLKFSWIFSKKMLGKCHVIFCFCNSVLLLALDQAVKGNFFFFQMDASTETVAVKGCWMISVEPIIFGCCHFALAVVISQLLDGQSCGKLY